MNPTDLEQIAREQLWPPGYSIHDCRDARFDCYIYEPFSVTTPDGPMKTERCHKGFRCDVFASAEIARAAAWDHYDAKRKP